MTTVDHETKKQIFIEEEVQRASLHESESPMLPPSILQVKLD